MYNLINYCIELNTETVFNDSSIGLYSGIFRFATGNMSGTMYYENGSINSNTYKEGMITKDGLSNPSRSINLEKAGDYGTISEFTFKLVNSDKFWTKLKSGYNINLSTNLNLIGKVVTLYTVIDNKFFQTWTGSVTELPRDVREFSIKCESAFINKYHKDMPSGVIPILYGSGNYVKLIPSGTSNIIKNGTKDLFPVIFATSVAAGGGLGEPSFGISLEYSSDTTFVSGYLKNKYISFIYGGSSDATFEKDKFIKIKDNYDSGGAKFIIIDDWFNCEPPVTYTRLGAGSGNYHLNIPSVVEDLFPITTSFNWYDVNLFFQIYDIDYKYYISDNQTTTDKYVYKYDEQLQEFIKTDILLNSISGAYYLTNFSNSNAIPSGDYEFYTNINYTLNSGTLLIPEVDASGDFTNPASWESDPRYIANSTLNDSKQETFQTFTANYNDSCLYKALVGSNISYNIILKYDISLENIPDSDNIYILPDITLSPYQVGTPRPMFGGLECFMSVEVHPKAITGEPISFKTNQTTISNTSIPFYNDIDHWLMKLSTYYPAGSGFISSGYFATSFNCPTNLYDSGFFPTSGTATFIAPETTSRIYGYSDNILEQEPYFYSGIGSNATQGFMKDYLKINETSLNYLKNGITKDLEVYVQLNILTPIFADFEVRVHGLKAFYANKTNLDNDIYIRAEASNISGINSSTVYGTFKSILEVNDQIPSGSIDYGNLELQRGIYSNWLVGRQITEQQNSSQYLQELCQQSYVAMFPTRDGKLKLNSWMDGTVSGLTFNDSNTIKNSINRFNYTQMKDINNNFVANYSYNYATKAFDNKIIITNTDKDTLPSISGNWGDYIIGMSNYSEASLYWNNAHSGYLLSQKKMSNPTNLQNLYWYNNSGAAAEFLDYCIRWTSVQHINTSFEIPMTSGNLTGVDLTSGVLFSNDLYTDNVAYSGYVTGLEYDLENNTIKVDAILDTSDYQPIDELLIVEGGSQPDQIVETGSRSNLYVEA